jgi:hypothetical protein
MSVHLFFSQIMVVLCLASLWISLLVVAVFESFTLPTSASMPVVDWSRIDTYALDDFTSLSRRDRFFCWWAVPTAAFAMTFWLTAFPAAEKIDRLYSWLHRRLLRRTGPNDTVITLSDLKMGDRCVDLYLPSLPCLWFVTSFTVVEAMLSSANAPL